MTSSPTESPTGSPTSARSSSGISKPKTSAGKREILLVPHTGRSANLEMAAEAAELRRDANSSSSSVATAPSCEPLTLRTRLTCRCSVSTWGTWASSPSGSRSP